MRGTGNGWWWIFFTTTFNSIETCTTSRLWTARCMVDNVIGTLVASFMQYAANEQNIWLQLQWIAGWYGTGSSHASSKLNCHEFQRYASEKLLAKKNTNSDFLRFMDLQLNMLRLFQSNPANFHPISTPSIEVKASVSRNFRSHWLWTAI
jgi:hypothetical protein